MSEVLTQAELDSLVPKGPFPALKLKPISGQERFVLNDTPIKP
jgi:hypothetical protein